MTSEKDIIIMFKLYEISVKLMYISLVFSFTASKRDIIGPIEKQKKTGGYFASKIYGLYKPVECSKYNC